jgi:hypothetical protein
MKFTNAIKVTGNPGSAVEGPAFSIQVTRARQSSELQNSIHVTGGNTRNLVNGVNPQLTAFRESSWSS